MNIAVTFLSNTSLTRTWFEEGYIESKIKMIENTLQNVAFELLDWRGDL